MKQNLYLILLFTCLSSAVFAKKLSHQDLNNKIEALQLQLDQAKSDWNSSKSNKSNKPSVKLIGRIMVDYGFLGADEAVKNATGTNAKNGAEFRRARLGAKGKYKNVEYQVEYDFARGAPSLRASYLRWRNAQNQALWFGHIKEPFGLEFNSSSKYPTFIENSLLAAFYPGYNTGVYFTEDSGDRNLSYSIGAFYDSDAFGTSSGADEDDLSLTGRVTYLFKNENKGQKLFHVGLSHTSRDGDSFTYRSRTENHLWTERFVDTGAILSNSTQQTGLEVVWHHDSLQIQAEHVIAKVDAIAGPNPDFNGTYIQASYFLTGEHRAYNDKFRLFSRVKPKSDYTPHGGRGAWQIAARYSTIDLNHTASGINGGKQTSTTFGVNWHLNSHSRVMLNQTFSDLEGIGDSDSTALRFQIDF